jgi:hypothetical protein
LVIGEIYSHSATSGLVDKFSNINVQAKVRALKFENSIYLEHHDPLVTEGVSIYKQSILSK